MLKNEDFYSEENSTYVNILKHDLETVFDYNVMVHFPGPIIISRQLNSRLIDMYNYFFMSREISARIHKHDDGHYYIGQAKGLCFEHAVNTVIFASNVEELKIIMLEIFSSDLVISESDGTVAFTSKLSTPMELTDDQIKLAETLFNMTHDPDNDFTGVRRTDYKFKCNQSPDRYTYTISLNKDSWNSYREGVWRFSVNGYTNYDYVLNSIDFERFIKEANSGYIEKMEKVYVLKSQENEERRNILNALLDK